MQFIQILRVKGTLGIASQDQARDSVMHAGMACGAKRDQVLLRVIHMCLAGIRARHPGNLNYILAKDRLRKSQPD
jgi:hypothetical protein